MTAAAAGAPSTGVLDTREAPWTFSAPWGARGWVTDLDGPVHWIEFTGSGTNGSGTNGSGAHRDSAPPIVFVHGLGGSHLNWVTIGSALAADRRAVALDLHGFGLTPGLRRNSTVTANAALLDRFLREVVGVPAVLVGNSMGGLISILQSARHPETVAGAVLLDPALPQLGQRPDPRVIGQFLTYALPGAGELFLRATNSRVPPALAVRQILALCFADPSRASDQLVEAMIQLTSQRRLLVGTEAPFLAAARSTMRTVASPRRYQAIMNRIRVPVLLINGEQDRLVSITSARAAAAANPHWQSQFLPGVGHTPQLEVPEVVIDAVRGWLAGHAELRTGRGAAS
ncbi:MAG TPA: alpha/beta hydrolase [Pseudonocardia sp.]|jgi:pimeloyl-ACP methyl ester carboxylesterase|nr:alpha/beta hydrolase [Pseudonocardia sp.]